MIEDRIAAVFGVYEEGPGEFVVIIGPGDGSFERWRVPHLLVKKIALESVPLALREGVITPVQDPAYQTSGRKQGIA